MKNEVEKYQAGDLPALTAEQVRSRVNLIQQVMRGVMKNGTDYGTIPGAGEKKTLFKSGAELLAATFQIAVDPLVEDLSTSDEVHFRVVCRATSQVTGDYLGSGIGEASSDEEKYHWRKAVCEEEFNEAAEDRRRIKWSKGRGGTAYQTKQVRTNPADVANTVLKMAKKRAQVDMTLTVTGASGMFTQDMEDLPPELRTQVAEAETPGGQVADEIIDPDTLGAVLRIAAKKGFDHDKVAKFLRLRQNFRGPVEEMTVAMGQALMKGLDTMADAEATPAPEASPATQEAAAPSSGVEAPPTPVGPETIDSEAVEDEEDGLDEADLKFLASLKGGGAEPEPAEKAETTETPASQKSTKQQREMITAQMKDIVDAYHIADEATAREWIDEVAGRKNTILTQLTQEQAAEVITQFRGAITAHLTEREETR